MLHIHPVDLHTCLAKSAGKSRFTLAEEGAIPGATVAAVRAGVGGADIPH